MIRVNQIIIVFFLFLMNSSCAQVPEKKTDKSDKYEYTNNLINESSPYLLQHAHNPVNWYPWGEEALKKAKDENKLLIISVGYSACHWCHVMEHESFEDPEVARIMNEHFVSIKVDREERPDVDQIYMTAVQLISGSGGWPLNAFALPDGKPFYADTYFPKKDWIKVLKHFSDVNAQNPSLLIEEAEKLTNGIHSVENVPLIDKKRSFDLAGLNEVFNLAKTNLDYKKGGTNRAPKFPMPSSWEYLLHYHHLSNNSEALKAVTVTLDNMAMGGIYDHVGGGFARYSTDANWHVPHFEKMLYDNAQLVTLYTHAYQQTKNPLYKKVVYETLEFIEREMTSPEGGFYSSLDADSEGEEGKFYVWTKAEIETILGKEAPLFIAFYNIKNLGNWEHGKNILFRNMTNEEFLKKHNLSVAELNKKIEKSKSKLLNSRSKRVRPGLDDKILTSWNALMLKGYTDAYRVFGDEKFLKAASANAGFILKKSISRDNNITRNYKGGKSSIQGFLDDYAFTISAFMNLYQATFDEEWLHKSKALTDYVIENFSDKQSGMFFYSHKDYSDLISRKMEVADNVIPASNSEMAKNLLLLGNYFADDAYINKSEQMLTNVQKDVHQNIYFYSNWGILEALLASPLYEVAIVGKDSKSKREEMDAEYLPNVIFLGGKKEGSLELLKNKEVSGETTIYVCQNKSCLLPVSESRKALQQLRNRK